MIDRNIVILSGTVGDDVKFARASNGKEYCVFSIVVNGADKELGDEDVQTQKTQFIHVIAFENPKAKLVTYLRDKGFKRGMRVNAVGMLTSRKTEVKGNAIVQVSVVLRDISINV